MERLKEFGFKGSKEEFDKAGGDLFKMKNNKGKTLGEMYNGGANKLADSAAGKWSTIKGNLQSGMADGGAKILEKLTPALGGLIPIAEKIASSIPSVVETVVNVFSKVGGVIGPLFSALGGVISPLIPHFQTLAGIIGPVISAAFSGLGSVITNWIVPTIESFGKIVSNVASVVMGVVAPVLSAVAGIIKAVVIPAFTLLISGAIAPFRLAMAALKAVTDRVKSAFDRIKGAVTTAVNSLTGIGGRIKDKISSALSGLSFGAARNAGGTSYFGGGITRVNEMGGEAFQLPKGTKIYPSGKTSKMLKNELAQSNRNATTKNVTIAPVINIHGANKTNKDVSRDIMKELKRLAVTV